MATVESHPDAKGVASLTLGDVITQTLQNFPDPRYHAQLIKDTPFYKYAGIDAYPYTVWATGDGTGTKPELAERLFALSKKNEAPKPELFETLAYDLAAMVESDEARMGRYMVGLVNIIDFNKADPTIIPPIARGLKAACDEGEFALMNGETAELGYRTSGYGDTRLNWNAVGISLINPDKLLTGEKLEPGQPIVAFREKSIRSNGLTMARNILEADFLMQNGYADKVEYIRNAFEKHGVDLNGINIQEIFTEIFGHDLVEQALLPWHELHPAITKELLTPSKLYGPVMRLANGKIDEPANIAITGAAHISGGGVPEKARRMVEHRGLGVTLENVFPDPLGVTMLLDKAYGLPEAIQKSLKINERTASEQWNRGPGFLYVTQNLSEAESLVRASNESGHEAEIAGEIIDRPEIHWRGNTWTYSH